MRDTNETRTTEDAQERLDDDGAPPRPHPDARRSQLRTLIGRINRTVPAVTLQVAWHDLIEALDLGPEPVTKSCPSCRAIVMRDATRCGHCGTYLRQ